MRHVTKLPYATREQAEYARERFELGVNEPILQNDVECYHIWEDEDRDGNPFAVILETFDCSGDYCIDIVDESYAREFGWIG
jgi:hypothetical protein